MTFQQIWTAEMLETITKLWFEPEWSATRIADRINQTYGTTVTRNAVIGQVHRKLGFVAKKVRSVGSGGLIDKPKPPRPPKPAYFSTRQRAEARPPLEPLPPDDQLIGVTLMDLEDHSCRWICAPTDEPIYCGRPKIEGRPYCAAHALRAKAPPRVRRRLRWNVRAEQAFRPG